MATEIDITNNSSSKLFADLNNAIIKISPNNIRHDKYPIYVTYYNLNTDLVFAVIYPKKEYIEIGLYLKKTDPIKGLKSAAHMKYPNITKSIIIKKPKDIDNTLRHIIKISYLNSYSSN